MKRKPRKKLVRLSPEKKLEIALFFLRHRNMPVQQVANAFGINRMAMYRIIYDYIDVKTVYTLKSTEKLTEQGSDKELPE